MNIIDFHVHAGDFSRLREDIQELLTRRPLEPGLDITLPFSDADHLEKYLKPHGVVRGIILAECGPGTNFSIDSELIADYCKDHPRFVPFGNINPNYHDVPAEFRKSLALGVKGFKFYPADHSYSPKTDAMLDVYRLCERFHIPIIFHTGLTAQKDTEQKFINPLEFQDIAERFPRLTLILAHSGKPLWYEEALDMAVRYDNVYVDTALVSPSLWEDVYAPCRAAHHKILFGSDWPVCGSYRALMDVIEQAELDADLLEKILFQNGNRLLNRVLDGQQAAEPARRAWLEPQARAVVV